MARIVLFLLLFMSGICACWTQDPNSFRLPVTSVHGPRGGLRIVGTIQIGLRSYADFIMDTAAQVTSLSSNCKHGSKEATFILDTVQDHGLFPFPGLPVEVSGIDIVCRKKKSNVAALGSSNSSLPYQLTSATGLPYRFAYCIGHGNGSNGVLFFGKTLYYVYWFGLIETTRWVQLDHIPLTIGPYGAYQLNLTGIGMKSILRGRGDIIQVGTSARYTSLPSATYKFLRKQFIKEAASKKIKRLVSTSFGELDLCYNMNSIQRRSLSNVTMVFNNGVEWIVAPNNYLIPKVGAQNVLCFAFVSAGKGPSIIGTFQQEELFIEYDLENKLLGVSGSLVVNLNTYCSAGT